MFAISAAKSFNMFLLKRIIIILSATIGGSLGIILLALVNWAFSLSLTFSHVFVYGIISGAATGVVSSYMLTVYLMKKAKRFVEAKFGGLASRSGIVRTIKI